MTEDRVMVSLAVTAEQCAWLDRMARNNGQMSRAAAIRRLIDNAMRRETADKASDEPR